MLVTSIHASKSSQHKMPEDCYKNKKLTVTIGITVEAPGIFLQNKQKKSFENLKSTQSLWH